MGVTLSKSDGWGCLGTKGDMAVEKVWRVEWLKYTLYKIRSFKDEHAARRFFQKHGTAKLSEIEYDLDSGGSRVLSETIAGDYR